MIHTDTLCGLSLRWTLVPIDALAALEPLWQDSLAQASRDPVFQSYIEGHTFRVPAAMDWASSVAVAVIPFPHRILPFIHKGQHRQITLPSPYYQGKVTRPMVREHLERQLSARVQEASTVPYKPLAASCGLGRYGRNGLVYAEGLGTAHSLAVFWTAAPARMMDTLTPKALALCATCSICLVHCPTGAIPSHFAPIRADRCVALWNELDRDLPETFPASSSNALVGCLACQKSCPANQASFTTAEILPRLSEDETALLLQDEWSPALERVLSRVLSRANAEDSRVWAPVIRRNLTAYLAAEPPPHQACPL